MPDDTLPPVPAGKPNTFRVWLGYLTSTLKWAWQMHPVWVAAIAGMIVGAVLPSLARALFG